MTEEFTVQLPFFEGPLDLLLHLIERRELDITKVSLAMVTDEYMAYLAALERVDPGRVADFLVVAARLLLLKSRMLLPQERQEEEEEEDDGEALARALEAYRQFKQIAELLAEREAAGLRAYVREAPPPDLEPRLSPNGVSVNDLLAALRDILRQKPPPPESVDTVVRPLRVTVRQRIRTLAARLRQGGRFRFEELFAGDVDRQDVIATFLALLETLKLGWARVEQEKPFAPIYIEPIAENVPAEGEEPDFTSEFDEPPAAEEA